MRIFCSQLSSLGLFFNPKILGLGDAQSWDFWDWKCDWDAATWDHGFAIPNWDIAQLCATLKIGSHTTNVDGTKDKHFSLSTLIHIWFNPFPYVNILYRCSYILQVVQCISQASSTSKKCSRENFRNEKPLHHHNHVSNDIHNKNKYFCQLLKTVIKWQQLNNTRVRTAKLIGRLWPLCLQCFDAVGWATGRASGL